jgi:CO/xanthine dehydrogenase Mo-binding subunit
MMETGDPLEQTRYVGQSLPRVDALDKVRGTAVYPQDVVLPGVLTARLLLSGRPRAIIRSINTKRAKALPGVVAVFTAVDVPVNLCGQIIADCPVLAADLVRFAGDKVAVVVAECEETTSVALDLIEVEYEDIPSVTDMRRALEPDAPLVNPGWGSNLVAESTVRLGDVDAGFAQADVIVEGEYETGAQDHAFLAPEAGVAYIDENGLLTIETAGQWAHDDRRQIAAALQLPEDEVRVIYREIGGAFGGREDISVQIVLALAAWKLRQPVRMVWSRTESLTAHHKRHPVIFKARLGAKRDGTLTAASVEVLADGGAFISTSMPVLSNAVLFSTGPYNIPNTCMHGMAVYTNNIPCGAMRGFGALQGNFCAEMQMNKMAGALGMDPVELRAKNLITQDSTLPNGSPLPIGAVGALDTLVRAAEVSGWLRTSTGWKNPYASRSGSRKARGLGFACGWKNNGLGCGVPDACEVTIEIHGTREPEKVVLRFAGAEVGQGTRTVMTQIAAEATNVEPHLVEIIGSDTVESPPSGTASASRMTMMAGSAVIHAAGLALQAWRNEERPAVGKGHYDAPITTPLEGLEPGTRTHYSLGFTAGCAEVEVDLDTGAVELLNFTSALDAGRAVNPQQVEGQAHGGLTQAIGWTMMEEFIQVDGVTKTTDFSTYLIPTINDIPEKMKVFVVENPDEHGPYGARGVGELPMLTAAPAILAAVHDAAGVWVDRVPARAEDVWKQLWRDQ